VTILPCSLLCFSFQCHNCRSGLRNVQNWCWVLVFNLKCVTCTVPLQCLPSLKTITIKDHLNNKISPKTLLHLQQWPIHKGKQNSNQLIICVTCSAVRYIAVFVVLNWASNSWQLYLLSSTSVSHKTFCVKLHLINI